MKSRSLADAKAHLSELVDEAEHHGKPTLILRHGKAAAVLVPVAFAERRARRARNHPRLSRDEARRSIEALIAKFSAAEPEVSAVDDLLQGRR